MIGQTVEQSDAIDEWESQSNSDNGSLDDLSLHPEHRADLAKSGLNFETVKQASIRSVPPSEISRILGTTLSRNVRSMMEFPYPGCNGFRRYKVFPTIRRKDGHVQKYFQPPDSPVYIYIPPTFNHESPYLLITEGEKKALKATQEGWNTIALGGVWSFAEATPENESPELLPQIKELLHPKLELVEICFDADCLINPHVKHALHRLGCSIRNHTKDNCDIRIPLLPPQSKLDDFLCEYGAGDFGELSRISLAHPVFKRVDAKEKKNLSRFLQTTSAQKLAEGKVQPVEFVFDKLGAVGVTLIIAPEKVGKTCFAQGAGLQLGGGLPVFGSINCLSVGTLLILLEDSEELTLERQRVILGGAPVPRWTEYKWDWPRLDCGGIELLQAYLTYHPECKFVVIDTWGKIKPREFSKRNAYDIDVDATTPLVNLANDFRVCFWLLHHSVRNRTSREHFDWCSGSVGLSGTADSMLILDRKRGEDHGTLHITGRRLSDRESLSFKFDGSRYLWTLEGSAQERYIGDRKKAILDVLRVMQEPLTSRKIASELKERETIIKPRLSELVKDGKVGMIGGGPRKPALYQIQENITNE